MNGPFRGLMFGLMFSLPLWLIIIGLVWWVSR